MGRIGRQTVDKNTITDMTIKLAGEENEDSPHGSRVRTTEDWKRFRMEAGEGEQLVYSGECRVGGVLFDADYAAGNADNIVTLKDESAPAQGTDNIIKVVYAGDTSAPNVDDLTMKGVRCVNGLTAQLSGTTAGDSEKITILYQEAKLS